MHDADLEIIVTCGPQSTFSDLREGPSLWECAPAAVKAKVDALQARYDFVWDSHTGSSGSRRQVDPGGPADPGLR